MLKLIIIFALALVCHGYSVPDRSNFPINYLVYNRDNPSTPQAIGATFEDVRPSIRHLVTVILIHGHQESGFTSLNPIILREIFLAGLNVNVIVVNWAVLASGSYSNSVNSVPYVATNIRNFLIAMSNTVPLGVVHLVGFNVGAHLAGISARNLPYRVGRITGLDPARSRWGSTSDRLRATDAIYVEVIHTDGGSSPLGNGIGEAIGTVDFLVNGGNNQPGCYSHTCSHERAFELFAASFNNPSLIGRQCTSNLQITLNACRGVPLSLGNNDLSKIGFGRYRINTGRRFPF